MTTNVPHTHKLTGLTQLAAVYLRAAVNNPKWTKGISDFIAGASIMDKLPDVYIPKDCVTDQEVLQWGSVVLPDEVSLTDRERDAARVAFRHAIDEKHVAINKHSVLLITLLGLE